MKQTRLEKDSFGEIEVPIDCYWGAHTQRSINHFKIGDEKIPIELIKALALVKKSAACANYALGKLDKEKADAIVIAADRILNDEFANQFPLFVWQTGSGTQTNMNMNEVIASVANEQLNGFRGGVSHIHPNDHVNMSQSSNDSFPTAMHISVVMAVKNNLRPALQELLSKLHNKVLGWDSIIKIGRTHLQDATPIRLSQEFSGYEAQISSSILRLENGVISLSYLAQGATAVGTGINCTKSFVDLFIEKIIIFTKHDFRSALNKFEAIATHDALVEFSGVLNTIAVSLMKIANDIRLLGSGPRCGLGELILPSNEPGSSIMPGKVNPTQIEALTMVCAQVIGNHLTVTIAGAGGHLELNIYKPVIIYNILQSVNLLSSAIKSFSIHCIEGLIANVDHINSLVNRSLMLVTALNPYIGYDKSAKIAKLAFDQNLSLKEAAIKLNFLSSEEFDKIVKLENMV